MRRFSDRCVRFNGSFENSMETKCNGDGTATRFGRIWTMANGHRYGVRYSSLCAFHRAEVDVQLLDMNGLVMEDLSWEEAVTVEVLES